VARSNRTTFVNSNWTTTTAAFDAWNKIGWRAVATVQVNNVQAGPVAALAANDTTLEAIFSPQTTDDEELAAALLSSSV
jgi:hypothetical protein